MAEPTTTTAAPDYRGEAYNDATEAGIDPDVFVRQIDQESGFDPSAVSPAGAVGIAQIVPQYHPGVDANDPSASLQYAAHLMRGYLDRYGGDYSKALAAYNAGPGAVDQYNGVPPYAETQNYVNSILGGMGGGMGSGPGMARGLGFAQWGGPGPGPFTTSSLPPDQPLTYPDGTPGPSASPGPGDPADQMLNGGPSDTDLKQFLESLPVVGGHGWFEPAAPAAPAGPPPPTVANGGYIIGDQIPTSDGGYLTVTGVDRYGDPVTKYEGPTKAAAAKAPWHDIVGGRYLVVEDPSAPNGYRTVDLGIQGRSTQGRSTAARSGVVNLGGGHYLTFDASGNPVEHMVQGSQKPVTRPEIVDYLRSLLGQGAPPYNGVAQVAQQPPALAQQPPALAATPSLAAPAPDLLSILKAQQGSPITAAQAQARGMVAGGDRLGNSGYWNLGGPHGAQFSPELSSAPVLH